MRSSSPWAALLGAALLCWTAEAATKIEVKPLSKAAKKALRSIPHDPAPENVIQDTHYFVSNEGHPVRFRKALSEAAGGSVGGIYIGVGAEQGYLFSSWALPEIMLLVDFDQMVVDIHAVYRIFLLHSDDADAFIARWHEDNIASSEALIAEEIDSDEDEKRILAAFKRARPAIHPQLWGLQLRHTNLHIPSFVSDPDLYQYIVDMHRRGRVRALRGDLTGDKTMRGIAKAAKKMELSVRALYLSNVEFYFDYDSGLGDNLLGLPSDEHSVVIRTYPFKTKDSDYRYFVQGALDFHAWLEKEEVANLRAIFTRAPGTLKDDVWYLPGP